MLAKPNNPRFSSGPTTKHPGWSIDKLDLESLGRSHRSQFSLNRIQELLQRTRDILGIPDDYSVAITPGSCTGAIEMAMWNLLGQRPIDLFSWGVFGNLWVRDVIEELKLSNIHLYQAEDGYLPDLSFYNPDHDCVLTWNETTTGVCVPNSDWIPADRNGLIICDATSAAFAMDLDWSKLDATAFSWQKCLGGEAGHGIIVLSPQAMERLESYTPHWPIPRLFRIKKDGKVIKVIFEGMTISTTSLLCIEDTLSALEWIQQQGDLSAMIQRSQKNFQAVEEWVNQQPWIEFTAKSPATRSTTSICMDLIDIPMESRRDFILQIRDYLADENVAFDIAGHKYASPNLRIWGGPMMETEDIQRLLPWIEKAYKKFIPSLAI